MKLTNIKIFFLGMAAQALIAGILNHANLIAIGTNQTDQQLVAVMFYLLLFLIV